MSIHGAENRPVNAQHRNQQVIPGWRVVARQAPASVVKERPRLLALEPRSRALDQAFPILSLTRRTASATAPGASSWM